MNNTYQIVLNWDKGQPFAERMSAKIIAIDGYENIDPQSPTGGPDGTKDIVCSKSGKKYIVGCYFANGQKEFAKIKDKFENDNNGVLKNNADGFIFITNQKITPTERVTLVNLYTYQIVVYHGEMVCGILDSPKGYGVRLEYLGIELTKEEQISFLNNYVDLKYQFDEINSKLSELMLISNRTIDSKLEPTNSLPIAGIKFTSRLSIEDLIIIHRIVIENNQQDYSHSFFGFRKSEIAIVAGNKLAPDYIPTPPKQIPKMIYELLKWWREEYMKVMYCSESDKISCIASFHAKFLAIHPFLDGNGNVARTIASLQFNDLLGRNVKFDEIDRNVYYNALKDARSGNKQKLNDLFTALITE